MKSKVVFDVRLVNEMIRSGWRLISAKPNRSKIEFFVIKEDSASQQEIRPSRRDNVTN